ncbi:MAG: hypothetical protein WBP81_07680 [Solirubrobacteraceae bacterium]
MDAPARHVVGLGRRRTLDGVRRSGARTAAEIGLVLYFICAVTAHLRVRDDQVGGAVFFLLLAAAALTVDLADHHHR